MITENDIQRLFESILARIKDEDLRGGNFVARRYRNRRIGEFFKELDLTEGRCTGIPKMRRAMEDNGSSAPVFRTDEERTYFVTVLPVNPEFMDWGEAINGGRGG